MSLFKDTKEVSVLILLLVICWLILPAAFCQGQNLKITFIDVGEGEAIFVESPEGKNTLIDSGNVVSGFKVLNYLESKGIYDLEYFILTHPHLDHIGGAFLLTQALNINHICDNGQEISQISKSQDIYRYYNDLVRNHENYNIVNAGDSLKAGSVNFNILWPVKPFTPLEKTADFNRQSTDFQAGDGLILPSGPVRKESSNEIKERGSLTGFIFSDWNVNSLVIMIQYNDFRCLLTGDLTSPGEKELLRLNSDLRADALKVGHHGSIDATSKEFLNQISPEIAVISIDKNNIRGYPSEETIKRLKKSGSQVLQTSKAGNITIIVTEDGKYSVKIEK